jgi:hypothetical protein
MWRRAFEIALAALAIGSTLLILNSKPRVLITEGFVANAAALPLLLGACAQLLWKSKNMLWPAVSVLFGATVVTMTWAILPTFFLFARIARLNAFAAGVLLLVMYVLVPTTCAFFLVRLFARRLSALMIPVVLSGNVIGLLLSSPLFFRGVAEALGFREIHRHWAGAAAYSPVEVATGLAGAFLAALIASSAVSFRREPARFLVVSVLVDAVVRFAAAMGAGMNVCGICSGGVSVSIAIMLVEAVVIVILCFRLRSDGQRPPALTAEAVHN